LHCPLMLHFGAKDSHIPLTSVEKILQALQDKGHVEIFVYNDADHGSIAINEGSYDRKSAMLAYGRTMVLLQKNTFLNLKKDYFCEIDKNLITLCIGVSLNWLDLPR